MWLSDHVQSNWRMGSAIGINDRGQIAVDGVEQSASASVPVRLDPIPPKLSIRHAPPNLLLSWAPAWPGIVLESAESLVDSEWESVDTGGTNVVSLPLESPHRFFRLNLDALKGLCCAPE